MQRRTLVPALLLVLSGIVLGSTVFREQIVHAATTPFQQVVIQNTATNPIPVQQTGTSSVSGTVKLDPAGNTVSLDSTDSGNLADVASHLSDLDSSDNPTSNVCQSSLLNQGRADLDIGENYRLCTTDKSWDVSTIVATGMDDDMFIAFYNGDTDELQLDGSDGQGTSVYQLNLTRPLRVTAIYAECDNSFEDCKFDLNVLGTVNG